MKKIVLPLICICTILFLNVSRVFASDFCLFDTLIKGQTNCWLMSPEDELIVLYSKTDDKSVTFQWRNTSWIAWLRGLSPATVMNISYSPKGNSSLTKIKSAAIDVIAQKLQLKSSGSYIFYIKAYQDGVKDGQVSAVELKLY